MFRLFNLFRRDIIADLIASGITVENFYRQLYAYVVLATTAIFTLSIVADVAGFNGLNIVLIPVWVLVIGYFGFHPTYLTLALTTGAVSTVGRDVDRQRIVDGIKAISEKWERYAKHLAMFGGVFFLTRFLVPIRAYPFAGMVMLGATITLGLWSWLYVEKAVYYKRYVLAIVLVSIVIGVFGALTGHRPAAGENPMAPMHHGVEGVLHNFFYKKTLELEVANLQPQKLCGVQPGKRTFHIPRTAWVVLDGDSYNLTSAVLVNWTQAGEPFEVADTGCITVSFNFNERAVGRTIPTTTLPLVFN